MSKSFTPEQIVQMLKENNYAVERALLVLFERQTADEQSSETTNVHNSMGFTAFDAEFMTSLAKRIKASNAPNGERLTANMFASLRKENKHGKMKIAKYAKQIAEVANARPARTGAAA